MSLFLIILAAGDSKRLKSNTPKPFFMVNNKTLLEHSFGVFKDFNQITFCIIIQLHISSHVSFNRDNILHKRGRHGSIRAHTCLE